MIADLAGLRSALALVEAATGLDWKIDLAITRLFDRANIVLEYIENSETEPTFANNGLSWTVGTQRADGTIKMAMMTKWSANLTTLVTLIERELPEADWEVAKRQGGGYGEISGGNWGVAVSDDPTLALVSAFLRALIAQHETETADA